MRGDPLLEVKEQDALVEWFRWQHPREILFKVPNDLVRGAVQAAIATRNGLVGGIPDLFLASPKGNFGGMFIEMKRMRVAGKAGGRPSLNQRKIIKALRDAGYYCVISYGWLDAKDEIEMYLRELVGGK